LKFEIQVRSILQHAWAEIEHDLEYKSREAVPRQIRRRFARLSGLLELADAEFVRLRNEIESYQQELPSEIETAPATVLIDRDSLTALIRQNRTIADLDAQIANRLNMKTADELTSLDTALPALDRLRITDIGSLEAELQTNAQFLPQFSEALISKMRRVYAKQMKRSLPTQSLHRGGAIPQLVLYLLAARIDPSELPMTLGAIGFSPNLAESLLAAFEEVKK
jgi:hypothetical protein